MTNRQTCPTRQYASELQGAFDFFNERLFGGTLPPCLISLQRRRRLHGYFSPHRYQTRDGAMRTHEIAMNPDGFVNRTPQEILSTLVHEMVHLWQHSHGKPGRGGYHNREWADKMDDVGLPPRCARGSEKRTGDSMTHDIDPAGPFATLSAEWLERGATITWGSLAPAPAKKKKKSGQRIKYACPGCGDAAWGKHELRVSCTACGVPMQPQDGAAANPDTAVDLAVAAVRGLGEDDVFEILISLSDEQLELLEELVPAAVYARSEDDGDAGDDGANGASTGSLDWTVEEL